MLLTGPCHSKLWQCSFWAALYWCALSSTVEANIFPQPWSVKKQVQFWEKIFSEYDSHQVVIHDMDDPRFIIDVIDFKNFKIPSNLRKFSRSKQRRMVSKAYIDRYKLALSRISLTGKKALSSGAMERRVFSVFRRNRHSMTRLLHGRIRLRSQTGLADEFIVAAKRAQEYLPYMENVFRSKGVPIKITRLAFVESMFNLKARSKVGASGIWQFMPTTAKQYMNINRLVDERNSPWKATVAAANLLSDNFRKLQKWPLAITAYNHGSAGMQRAVRLTRSQNIGTLIEKYHSRSFRYASKNFYGEFLAAANVYDRLVRENKVITQRSIPVEKIVIKHPISISQIIKNTPINKSTLKKYNQCIRKKSYKRYLSKKLPKNYQIFVPKYLALKVRTALSKAKKRYARLGRKK